MPDASESSRHLNLHTVFLVPSLLLVSESSIHFERTLLYVYHGVMACRVLSMALTVCVLRVFVVSLPRTVRRLGWGRSEIDVGIEDWGFQHPFQALICETP
jgi:hypothetical protein